MSQSSQFAKPIIRGVIFDLDETLIEIEKLYDNAYRQLAVLHGRFREGQKEEDEKLLHIVRYDSERGMIGKGEPTSTELFMNEFRLDGIEDSWIKSRDRLMAEVAKIQLDVFREAKYMPGAEAFVDFIHSKNIPTAIATASAGGAKTDAKLHGKDVLHGIPVFTGDTLGPGKNKPEPDIFWFASQQIGIPLYECAVVEDSIIGLKAGIQSGARIVIFVPNKLVDMDEVHRYLTEIDGYDQVRIRNTLVDIEQELEPFLTREPGDGSMRV